MRWIASLLVLLGGTAHADELGAAQIIDRVIESH